jgi:hypothetical protein
MLQVWIGKVRAEGAPGERASRVSRRSGTVSRCVAALTLAACGGDDGTMTGEAGMSGPVYALMSAVFSANGDRSVYVTTTGSLDVPELSLDGAREYGGVANYAAVNGRLLISSGEAPTITAYDVDDAMNWHERETLSFASYPLTDNANFFAQYLVDDHHMYLPFEGYKRIVWDPTDFQIRGVMEDTSLELDRGGLILEPGGNRSGIRYAGGQVMMPFFYHDEEWYEFGAVSPIAVYDPVAHTERKVVEAPCSGLAVASQDEAGYTYFSPFDYGPLLALYGLGPSPCVARLTPEHELDAGFTTDMRAWTDGRYVNGFRYIRDGWGLANVFHHERLGADFSAPMSAEVQDQVWDEANWSVWQVDLVGGAARPVDAIEVPSFGWNVVQIDGRSLLSIPSEGTTTMYELDPDGNLSPGLTVTGDATWIRVR